MAIGHLFTGALKRDQWIVGSLLIFVILAAWAYLLAGAGMSAPDTAMQSMDMPGMTMDGMNMPLPPPTWTYAVLIFVMWAAMMAAMMLPSAAPMILFYGTIAHRRSERDGVAGNNAAFAAGYLLVWIGFSLIAALVQLALSASGLIDFMMAATDQRFSGMLLIAAGAYQWSPLKQACLKRCRSPLDFIMTEWREGTRGAFIMGLRHGLICVGCCWALMLLLLVGGVMSLTWIAGIAMFVLLEKLAPAGPWTSRVAGALLVGGGIALLLVK